MNIYDELKKFLEGFKYLGKLKDFVDSHCDCDDECEDDEDESDDNKCSCELIQSFHKDYDGFFKWAFNGDLRSFSKKEARTLWDSRHPDLPVPRIIQSECILPAAQATISLFMDAFGYYLLEKEDEESEILFTKEYLDKLQKKVDQKFDLVDYIKTTENVSFREAILKIAKFLDMEPKC